MAEIQKTTGKGTEVIRVIGFLPYFNKVNQLKKDKETFTTITTSNTRCIKLEGITGKEKWIFSDDFFPMSLMPLIKKLKADVEWHAEAIKFAEINDNPFEVDYYDFAASVYRMEGQKDHESTYFDTDDTSVYEADISMCYYITAFKLGFMSEAMFNECKDLPKKHRLKLLGAIATTKTVRNYQDGRIVDSYPLESEILRMAWFKICYYVGQAMQTIKHALGKNFLFYWVDGIYFKYPKNNPLSVEDLVANISKHLFFEWKIESMYMLRISNKYGKLEIKIIGKKGEHPDDNRFFYPPRKKIIAYRNGSEYDFLNI